MGDLSYEEAVQYAKQELEKRQSYFDRAREVRIDLHATKYQLGGGDRKSLLADALSDDEAEEAIRIIIKNHQDRGDTIPSDLQEFAVNAFKEDRKPKGKKRPKNTIRDFYIALTVWSVTKKTGWNATRNRDTKTDETHSACQVVSEAFTQLGTTLTEAGAEKAWESYKHLR